MFGRGLEVGGGVVRGLMTVRLRQASAIKEAKFYVNSLVIKVLLQRRKLQFSEC